MQNNFNRVEAPSEGTGRRDPLEGFTQVGPPLILDENGVFYDPRNGYRSHAMLGLSPSTVLRYFLRWRQQGLCAECGIEEWANCKNFDVHRYDPLGLYSIHNTELLCRACHHAVTHGLGRAR